MSDRRTAKYFLCFRPADAGDGAGRLVGKRSDDDRGSKSARIGSVRDQGNLRGAGKRLSADLDLECSRRCYSYSERVMKSAPKDREGGVLTHSSGNFTGGHHSAAVESGPRWRSRKAFARIVNAIAFINLPLARSRNGKSSQERNQPASFSNRARGEDRNRAGIFSTRRAPPLRWPVKPDEKSRRPPNHDTQKVDSSASISRSSTSSSISVADTLDFEKGNAGCKYHNSGTTTALCLLAFTLAIMVLWGRLCAIFWTSTWLFFGCRRQFEFPQKIAYSPPESTVKLPEVETEEYKKRIIMEGLLGRNHCRA